MSDPQTPSSAPSPLPQQKSSLSVSTSNDPEPIESPLGSAHDETRSSEQPADPTTETRSSSTVPPATPGTPGKLQPPSSADPRKIGTSQSVTSLALLSIPAPRAPTIEDTVSNSGIVDKVKGTVVDKVTQLQEYLCMHYKKQLALENELVCFKILISHIE